MGRERKKSIVEQLYDRHYTPLFLYAYALLQDDDEAKDVVGEVFTTLWNKWNNKEIVDLKVTYAYSMTRNRCMDCMRKRKVHDCYVRLADKTRYESPEEVTNYENKLTRVREVCGKLKEPSRTVLWYCYFKKYTYQQTADTLGLSLTAVKKAMQYAFTALRGVLRDEL
ncbi:MAG: RNA polymerase sigma factor [Prevotella sp.]